MSGAQKPGLVAMMVAGFSALRRYPGLALAVYGVQLAASALVGIAVTFLLQGALGEHPIIDRTAAGDIVSLLAIFGEHPMLAAAAGALMIVAALGYGLVSWFLHGGLIAVYLRGPRGRREVAEAFGAGGATTYFAYARLFALSLVAYVLVAIAFAISASVAGPKLATALSWGEAISTLVWMLLPPALLLAIARLVIEYARIDITRRKVGALRGAGRSIVLVFSSWRPAAFALLYYVFVAAIFALAWWWVPGPPLATAAAFAAAIAGRQAAALLRFFAKLALIAGEIDFAERARPRPVKPVPPAAA